MDMENKENMLASIWLFAAAVIITFVEVLLCLGSTAPEALKLLPAGLLLLAVIAAYKYILKRTVEDSETAANQAEARIQSLQKELEKQQYESARELEKQQKESRESLLELQESYDKQILDFCSNVSHGIRLPVSVAAGYADLLRSDAVEDPNERSEYLNKISERLYYMNDLLTRNISTMRGDSGQLRKNNLQKTEFDLVGFMRKAMEDFSPVTEEQGISLQLVTVETELNVNADRVLLLHMLDSLVENASKYMRRRGTVTFILTREQESIQLVCQDDGMGMDESQVAHIFQKGYRGENTSGLGGSGRGLYMVDVIVRAHEGSIQASSAYGSGMRIAISLPIAAGQNT